MSSSPFYDQHDGRSSEAPLQQAGSAALPSDFLRHAGGGGPTLLPNNMAHDGRQPVRSTGHVPGGTIAQQFMPGYAQNVASAHAIRHVAGTADPRAYQMMQPNYGVPPQGQPAMRPPVEMTGTTPARADLASVPSSLLARERWTREEDSILLRSRTNGLSWRAIAELIGTRTVSACRSRHYSLTSERNDEATLLAARNGDELNAAVAAGKLDTEATVDEETLRRIRVRSALASRGLAQYPAVATPEEDPNALVQKADPAETDFYNTLVEATLASLKGVLTSDAFRKQRLDEPDQIVRATAQLSAAVAAVVCSTLLKQATDFAPAQGVGTKRSRSDDHSSDG